MGAGHTRLVELRQIVDTSITVRAILEPLQSCPEDACALEMHEVLQRKDFDIAGVQANPHSAVIGFVERASLVKGCVGDHVHTITVDDLVSDSTPLSSLLRILGHRNFCLVLVGSEVRGIVTRADLNKPPSRLYLFGLVSLLEMHLTFWVTARFTEESIAKSLNPARRKVAMEIQAKRREIEGRLPLIDCLQFCDKRDIFMKLDDCLDVFHSPSKTRARRLLEAAERLRDSLAHSQSSLSSGQSWEDLADVVDNIEEVLVASDDRIEREAHAGSEPDHTLWVSA